MRQSKLFLLFTIPIMFLLITNSGMGKSMSENKKNPANENWLKVYGDQIVNQKGDTICLRGFGLGGGGRLCQSGQNRISSFLSRFLLGRLGKPSAGPRSARG